MLSDSDLNGYDTFIHIFMFSLVLTVDLHDKLLPQVRKFKRKQKDLTVAQSHRAMWKTRSITFLTGEVSLAHPLPQGVAKPLLKLDKILSFQEVIPSPSTQCKQAPEQGSCLLVTAAPTAPHCMGWMFCPQHQRRHLVSARAWAPPGFSCAFVQLRRWSITVSKAANSPYLWRQAFTRRKNRPMASQSIVQPH